MMMPDDAKSAQTMAEGARWRKAGHDANRPKRWHEGQMEDESTFMEHHLREEEATLREEEATCFEVSRKGKEKRRDLAKAGNCELMIFRIYSELQM